MAGGHELSTKMLVKLVRSLLIGVVERQRHPGMGRSLRIEIQYEMAVDILAVTLIMPTV